MVKASEFCDNHNLSQDAVPIIINHVKQVLVQHQNKIEEINSTPSWQQNNLTPGENFNDPKVLIEGKSMPPILHLITISHIYS